MRSIGLLGIATAWLAAGCVESHGQASAKATPGPGTDASQEADAGAPATDGGPVATRVSCNPNDAHCREVAPDCPDGFVASVANNCWDECVPVAECEPAVVNCDSRVAFCDAPTPLCPDGLVPSVVGGCWGVCVPPFLCIDGAAPTCDFNPSPARRYVGQSTEECTRIFFGCEPHEDYFADECGCGCAARTETCRESTVPGVRYLGASPEICTRIDFRCEPTEAYFASECGCGCLPQVSCDQRLVACDALTPTCPEAEVPSVVGACYGACVPAEWCAPMSDAAPAS